MRVHRTVGVLVASLAAVLAGCENGHGVRIGFNTTAPFVGASPVVGASLFPQTIGFMSVPGSRCPTIAPFLSSFSLFIDQRGGSDIFLDQVVFQFADRSGHRSPTQFRRDDLTRMFGTTFVGAGATRSFDFTSQFGCGFLSVPSLLYIDLITLNRSGVTHQSTLTATLR